jgi:hypothetical protein
MSNSFGRARHASWVPLLKQFEDAVNALPLPGTSAEITTGASPVNATIAAYSNEIVTGGTQGSESLVLPDGLYPGQRLHVTLATLTDMADDVSIDADNLIADSATLDAADEYFLFEWTGAAWAVLYGTGATT